MYKKTVLENNLRVISYEKKESESITLLILVRAGSRYEVESERGLSHFLEHMFFKGAKDFPTAESVAKTIDEIGGAFNAFTGKEYAGYYVKCAKEHAEVAFHVLSDMMKHSTFQNEEINKEQGVILEELNMYKDTPMYQVAWDFEALLFGDQPLGWDTIGKKEVITSVQHQDFVDYKNILYTPDNMLVCVSGGLSQKKATELSQKYFSDMSGEKQRDMAEFIEMTPEKRVVIAEKKTEQAHFVIGGKGLESRHEDVYALEILSVLTGGMMSSRMFLNIREKKGLCYYISTSTDTYFDAGSISTRAGVDLSRIEEALESIVHEYNVLAKEGITNEELEKGKNYVIGKMKLRLEDSEEIAGMIGTQELLYNEVLLPKDIEKKFRAVTLEDVNRLAKQFFGPENRYLSLIGPFKGKEEEFIKILNK